MDEQAEVSEGQVSNKGSGPKYPKTMKRGPLAGQTFQTDGEYKAAMAEAHKNGAPKRARRTSKPRPALYPTQPIEQYGNYRLQVDLNGQKIVAEGPVTQAQVIEIMRLVAPKS